MILSSTDRAFRRFQRTGDPAALAQVFDRTAPELLALAGHLASTEASAEDLVQATFVSAIESVRSHVKGRAVLPWLVGILANHARVARRRSRREPIPGRLVASSQSDPVEQASEEELHATLDRSIGRLPEVYRPVLRLVLEQGREPSEIARLLHRAPGTVRVQLSRGLGLLRRSLPAGVSAGVLIGATSGRGLAAVRSDVLARAAEASRCTAKAATAATGGALSLVNLKLALIAGSLIGVVLFGYLAWPEAKTPSVAQAVARSEPGALEPLGTPASEPVDAAGLEAGRVALDEPVPASQQDPRPSERHALSVRVVRGDPAVPLPDVGVRLERFAPSNDPSAIGTARRTDAGGLARFEDLEPGGYRVHLDRAGSLRVVQVPGRTEIEIPFPPGICVQGRVVDEQGLAVRAALVLAHDGTLLEPGLVARADDEGRFTIEDLAPSLGLEARVSGHVHSLVQPVIGRPGSKVALVLVLGSAGRDVSGIVRRPDRSPVADALVAVMPADAPPPDRDQPRRYAQFARTNAAGRFSINDVERTGLRIVACPAAGGEESPGLALLDPGDAEAFVDLVLRRGAVLEGVVNRAPKSAPGENEIIITAWATEPQDDLAYLLNLLGHRRTNMGADCSYRLPGLMPGTHELRVLGGRPQNTLARGRCTLEEGEHRRWDVEIGLDPSLSLKVVPPVPPAPLGVWQAVLYRVPKKGDREPDSNRDLLAGHAGLSSNGEARFSDLVGGPFELVLISSLAGTPRSQLVIATRSDLWPGAQVEIKLSESEMPSAHVTGKVLNAAGEPWANAPVLIDGSGGAMRSYVQTSTAGQGAFSVGPLPAGRYSIRFGVDPSASPGSEFELVFGQTLDLGALSGATPR